MESNSSRLNVSFVALQSRLIQFVNLRIKNGDFTERGLARVLGISQSHVHNVLKGARKLQPELADHVMCKFGMGVSDLLKWDELNCQRSLRHEERERNPNCAVAGPAAHVPLSKLDEFPKLGPTAPDICSKQRA